MAKGSTSQTVNVTNEIANLEFNWFLGDAGSVTIKGIFINKYGQQTGVAISTTILIGNASNPPQQISTSIPSDAIGFIGNTSGGLRMAIYASGATALVSDFTNNYGNYPLLAAGNALNFGSVAVV